MSPCLVWVGVTAGVEFMAASSEESLDWGESGGGQFLIQSG